MHEKVAKFAQSDISLQRTKKKITSYEALFSQTLTELKKKSRKMQSSKLEWSKLLQPSIINPLISEPW